MDIPATSDAIPGTLVLRGALGNSVLNSITASGNYSSGNGPWIFVTNTNGVTPGAFGPGFVFNNSVSGSFPFIINQVQDSTSRLAVSRFNSPFTEFLTIRQSGEVGIGTANPTEKLEVSGTVKAAGFSADGIQIEGLSGRNYFRDAEAVGELRVGAAWGLPGIYSQSGRCVVGGQGGVSIEPIGASNVGVGTSTPDSKAILDVSSTTRGFLPPRMTTTERDAITSPPAGLMLYNSTTNKLQVRTDTAWVDLH